MIIPYRQGRACGRLPASFPGYQFAARAGTGPAQAEKARWNMWLHKEQDCHQILIDLLCYEKCGGRLSPEMERLLQSHVDECPSCMRKVLNFMETLTEEETVH